MQPKGRIRFEAHEPPGGDGPPNTPWSLEEGQTLGTGLAVHALDASAGASQRLRAPWLSGDREEEQTGRGQQASLNAIGHQ
jgi:hypothetical protein